MFTFRGLNYDAPDAASALTERLAAEQTKKRDSQGSRTNAREMRRTLKALGWIGAEGQLTQAGMDLLATQLGSLDERALLAGALWDLTVGEEPEDTSHPVRFLVRLLDIKPSDRREGLELALEAQNDSDAEWSRVQSLYNLSREQRRRALAAAGVSDFQILNAVKIFPTLAKTAGLIIGDEKGHLTVSPDGNALLDSPSDTSASSIVNQNKRKTRNKTYRKVTKEKVASRTGDAQRKFLSKEEQEQAGQQLADRTAAHQRLVKETARLIAADGELFEDTLSFDLLFVPLKDDYPICLFEMKTISFDERTQIRRAVGQLSWYHYFDVSPHWPGRSVIEVIVVDRSLPEALLTYLRGEEINALLVEEGQLVKVLEAVDRSPILTAFGQLRRDA